MNGFWGAGLAAKAINHLLDQQPSARADLAVHQGAVFRLALDGVPGVWSGAVPLDFTILPDGGLSAGASEVPRVTIAVSVAPEAALAWLKDGQAGAMRSVRIEGDAALATALAGLTKRLRWDAEDDLAKVIGDVAAHRVGETVRASTAHAADWAQRSRSATVQWLVNEEAALVGRPELEQLRDDLARLRDDLERLGKRVERLVRVADSRRA